MSKLTDRKQITALVMLCTIVYFVSYLTRLNFSVVLVEIMNAENIAKTALSLVVTWNAIAYGIGQPISGYLGDKLDPAKIIFTGLTTTTVVNVLMPFASGSVGLMTVLWAINGFAQAMLWPPMIKILTGMLSGKEYKKASVTVVTGSSVATVLLYLIAPAFITLSGWRSLFFFSAICGLAITVSWLPSIRKIQKQADGQAEENNVTNTASQEPPKEFTKPVVVCLFVIMFTIILQGFLRDGVTTWMPSFVSETYHTSSSTAILSSVVLPLFSVACFHIVSYINRKLIKNELLCASIFYGIATIASVILAFNINSGIAVAIGLNTLITGCMHGINLVLNTYVPVFFRKYGRVSLISGVLNACTYVGTAIASPVIAITSETYGWNITVLTWALIAFVGVIACGALVKPWKTIK